MEFENHTAAMSEPDLLAFILRLMRLINPMDCDDILWRTDSEYAPVSFFVNCNDLFFWGCADAEDVTPVNIALLEDSYREVHAIQESNYFSQALFCSRVRGMRPQGAAYPENESLWPLFDACGPIRETGLGNPYQPGTYKRKSK